MLFDIPQSLKHKASVQQYQKFALTLWQDEKLGLGTLRKLHLVFLPRSSTFIQYHKLQ